MTTEWVISAGSERVELKSSGTKEQPAPSLGEITFMITNPGPVEDRAVFEIVPGDGAKREWFTIDEPQRTVPAGKSVPYLIKITVPVGEPAGPFSIQGRVYSADTAPEESSRLSGRVTGEVPASEVKPSKPWWLLAVAGLVIIVVGVVVWLVVLRPAPEPIPDPLVPPLSGMTKEQAEQALADKGLKLGMIKRSHQPGGASTIIDQSIDAEMAIPPGSVVDVVIAIELTTPQLTSPPNGHEFAAGTQQPALQWEPVTGAAGYHVRREYQVCLITPKPKVSCNYRVITNEKVTDPKWQPDADEQLPFSFVPGWMKWQVAALDDFDEFGPTSGYFSYRIAK